MTKSDKQDGIPKVADQKRIDPPQPRGKGTRKKKQYPPHWQIRSFGIWPSKILRSHTPGEKSDSWHWELIPEGRYNIKCYGFSKDYENARNFLEAGMLDEALAIYAKHHPETANWPVRFVNGPPMKTTREVL